jgi:hypothetical protein
MKLSAAAKAVVFTGALVTLGCQEPRPTSPSDVSLFIPNADGIWSGPMTLADYHTGDLCTGEMINTFLPIADVGTLSIAQQNADTSATFTTESTGLACRYDGTASLTAFAMNAKSCDRTGLLVNCAEGGLRVLRLVGSRVTGVWNGDRLQGETSATYNVFLPKDGGDPGLPVASLVTTHNFSATRR